MNYKVKSKLDTINKILAVILVITLIALVLVVSFYKGNDPQPQEGNAGGSSVATAIEEFKPGTYGGVEFKTPEDVAAYYVKCYNYTKTLTAEYTVDGKPQTMYKLLGGETLEIKNLLIEGKANPALDKTVGSLAGSQFKSEAKGLPPNGGNSPENDKSPDGSIVYTDSAFTGEDIQNCNVKDNNDGTITIQIQPKKVTNAKEKADSQGKFFNVLGDVPGIVDELGIVTFTTGSVTDNVIVDYDGGYGTIVIDTATGEIVKADYLENIHISITHANAFGIVKDKSASLDIVYNTQAPASDEFFAERKIVKK